MYTRGQFAVIGNVGRKASGFMRKPEYSCRPV